MTKLTDRIDKYLDLMGDYRDPTKSGASGVSEKQWELLRQLFVETLIRDPDSYLYLFGRRARKLDRLASRIDEKLARMLVVAPSLRLAPLQPYTAAELDRLDAALMNAKRLTTYKAATTKRQEAMLSLTTKMVREHNSELKRQEDGMTAKEAVEELRDLVSDVYDLALRTLPPAYWLAPDDTRILDLHTSLSEKHSRSVLDKLHQDVQSGVATSTDINVAIASLFSRAAPQSDGPFNAKASTFSAEWEPATPAEPAVIVATNSAPFDFYDGILTLDYSGTSYSPQLPEATRPSVSLKPPTTEEPYLCAPQHQAVLTSESYTPGPPLVRKQIAYAPCEQALIPLATLVTIDATTSNCTIANDATFFNTLYAGDLILLDRTVHAAYPGGAVPTPLAAPTWEFWRILMIVSPTTAVVIAPPGAGPGSNINVASVLIDDRVSVTVDGQSQILDLSAQWPAVIADARPAWPSTGTDYYVDWLGAGVGTDYRVLWGADTWDLSWALLVGTYNTAFTGGTPFSTNGSVLSLTSAIPGDGGRVAIAEDSVEANRTAMTPMQSVVKLWDRVAGGDYRLTLSGVVGEFARGEDVTFSVSPGGAYEVYSYVPQTGELVIQDPGAPPVGVATGAVSTAVGTVVGTGYAPVDVGTDATDGLLLYVMDRSTGNILVVNQALTTGRYTDAASLVVPMNIAFAAAGASSALSIIVDGGTLSIRGDYYGSRAWVHVAGGSANESLGMVDGQAAHGTDVASEGIRTAVEDGTDISVEVTRTTLVSSTLVAASDTSFLGLLSLLGGTSDLSDKKVVLTSTLALAHGSVTGGPFSPGDEVWDSTVSGAKGVIDEIGTLYLTLKSSEGVWSVGNVVTNGTASATVTAAPGPTAGEATYDTTNWAYPILTVDQDVPTGMYQATVFDEYLAFRSQDSTLDSSLTVSAGPAQAAIGFPADAEQRGQTYWVSPVHHTLADVVSPPFRVGDSVADGSSLQLWESAAGVAIEKLDTENNKIRLNTAVDNNSSSNAYVYAKGRSFVISMLNARDDGARAKIAALPRMIEQAYSNPAKVADLLTLLTLLAASPLYSLDLNDLPNDSPAMASLFSELETRKLSVAKERLESADIAGFLSLTAQQTTDWGTIEASLESVRKSLPELSQEDVENILLYGAVQQEGLEEEYALSAEAEPPPLEIDGEEEDPWLY